jgi:hypothetical protein
MTRILLILGLCLGLSTALLAQEKTIGVFVALADNQHQGIIPVPKAIGNGDDPERNLYWGTAEGIKGVFDKSRAWTLVDKQDTANGIILRTRTYLHKTYPAKLIAKAYQGAAIQQATQDFEQAVREHQYDLAIYVGHNGLMDFHLAPVTPPNDTSKATDAMVLACKSAAYFQPRLQSLGAKPVLLTTQFMYPGAFIVEAATESWLKGQNRQQVRASAGKAYANNQKLSVKAGTGIFADLGE